MPHDNHALAKRYGADFIDSLPRTTPKLVNDRLTELGTTDATHDKARSFFVNAAKAVGLQMPPQVAKQARNRPVVNRRSGSRRTQTEMLSESNPPLPPPPPPPADSVPDGLHPALVPLLRDLAENGPSWTVRLRDRWKRTWDQSLDYAYPVEEEPE